jgi:hypothetical protein
MGRTAEKRRRETPPPAPAPPARATPPTPRIDAEYTPEAGAIRDLVHAAAITQLQDVLAARTAELRDTAAALGAAVRELNTIKDSAKLDEIRRQDSTVEVPPRPLRLCSAMLYFYAVPLDIFAFGIFVAINVLTFSLIYRQIVLVEYKLYFSL